MSVFVRLFKEPPLDLFLNTLRHSRDALAESYYGAFEAGRQRNAALDAMHWPLHADSTKEQHLLAFTKDTLANHRAAIVLLAADDALQRLGRSMLGKEPGLRRGFGPRYRGDAEESLTSLLRAATNCIRHVSTWDDNPDLTFPYGSPADATTDEARRALHSISVLRNVLGVGKHDRIYAAPSFHTLCVIDGRFDTEPVAYERFAGAVMLAGRAIAAASGESDLSGFDREQPPE